MADLLGYTGKLLEVDLSKGTSTVLDIDQQMAKDYIGGRPYGVKYLWDAYGANWANVDPLGPDAILLFMQGPLNGFGAGKSQAVFKSPMSGAAMTSGCSGDWSASLRFAGYDGLILKGQSPTPVYLFIDDDNVEIRDATDMWGKDTFDTHQMLIDAEGPRADFLYIGPGGENQVYFAAVMNNWYRAAARGGAGAVMGSKKLKAIGVRGSKPAPAVSDISKLQGIMCKIRNASPFRSASMHEYGTAAMMYTQAEKSTTPVRNWQEEWADHPEMQGSILKADYWVRQYWSDYACTVACSKLGRVKAGPYAGTVSELPDYEGGAYLGPNLDIYDLAAMLKLNDMSDRYGVDCISTGSVMGFAGELFQRGILTKDDFDGLEPKWGDSDAFLKLMEMIVNRKAIGDTLANGTYHAAQTIGQDTLKYTVQVKGIDLGAHGVRAGHDYTAGFVAYALCTQGGDHCSPAFPGGTEMMALEDASVACGFWTMSIEGTDLLDLLNASTGYGITQDDLTQTFYPRWLNLQRGIQLLAGWTTADDAVPPRFYDPLTEGPDAGAVVDKDAERAAILAEYQVRGWDEKGIPTSETLKKSGLDDLDKALEPLR